MFASRQGFFGYTPPIAPGNFGNSAFWGTDYTPDARWLSTSSDTDLITWKATTGFTIEYWIYQTSEWPGTINPGPGNQDASGTNYWSFGPGLDGQLEFYYWGPGQNTVTTASYAMALDTWYNVCMVATTTSGTATVSLYIDGVRQQVSLNGGSFADTATITDGVVDTGTPFRMGSYGGGFTRWRGYMDNMRVSNVNRYSGSSYSVNTEPFTSDSDTQLLLICDGANNSTSFTDSSSFNRTIDNNLDQVIISNAKANHTN